jgi:invasion protein IalB
MPLLALAGLDVAASAADSQRDLSVAPVFRSKIAQQAKPSSPTKVEPMAGGDAVAAWAVNCTDQGRPRFTCEMTQSLIDGKTKAQLMLLSIKSVATGDAKALLVRIAHGVYLPTGVSVKVDSGQSTPIAFQKSDQLGVYAALPLTDRIVADMKRGKELHISVELNKGEPLELVARLNGFGPAFDRISSVQ